MSNEGHTSGIHVLLDFTDKIPNFRAAFWVLKTERVINTIWLSPNNKRICMEEALSAQVQWEPEGSHTNLAVFDRRHSNE
jgi:hypothetical protein